LSTGDSEHLFEHCWLTQEDDLCNKFEHETRQYLPERWRLQVNFQSKVQPSKPSDFPSTHWQLLVQNFGLGSY
jgi:hypothetical protein